MTAKVPENLRPYVDVLGSHGTVEFLLAFGGAPVYLAAQPQARSSVAAVVGMERAKALATRIGAGHVRVPNGKKWIARQLHAEGVGVYAIARRLHVSEVTVRSYLRDEEGKQGSLFG